MNHTRLRVAKGMRGATGNLYRGLHEFGPMSFALHLLRPGDVFFDVGANVGSYSVLASSVGATVYAFEPGERFEDLEKQFALNRIDGRAIRAAVGAEPGVLPFTRNLDTIGRPALRGEDATVVPVVTLDGMIEMTARPVLVKIDVEGYEGAVLAGAERLLKDAPPLAIIMEVGQGERFGFDDNELARRMTEDYGYAPMTYDPFSRTLAAAPTRSNVIYVRAGVAERLAAAEPFRVLGRMI